MGMPKKSSPFELLMNIDQLYQSSGNVLPEQKILQSKTWTGIGFQLDNHYFVIGIDYLEEIILEPSYTFIPIVKPWLKGVANMRGHLLPVMDLNKLFGMTSVTSRKQHRVMAVKSPDEGYVGFLVDAVYGMQHFSMDSILSTEVVDVPELLLPFISGVYQGGQQNWLVFDAKSFMASSQFLAIGQ